MATAPTGREGLNYIVSQIDSKHQAISMTHLPQFRSKVESHLNAPQPHISPVTPNPEQVDPKQAKNELERIAHEIYGGINSFFQELGTIVEAVEIPKRMYEFADEWVGRGSIQETAHDAAYFTMNHADILSWTGTAKKYYSHATKPQLGAAQQLQAIAEDVASALTRCAGAANVLYWNILNDLDKLIQAFEDAGSALGEVGSFEATPEGVKDLKDSIYQATDAVLESGIHCQQYFDTQYTQRETLVKLAGQERNWPSAVTHDHFNYY